MDTRGRLKARFNHHADTKSTTGKACVLAISVGQPYHEAEKLLSTVELINKSQFSSCCIIVGDTLQRHNLEIASLDEARDAARLEGELWIIRNRATLEMLQVPWDIKRWDDVVSDQDYPAFRQQVEQEYHRNPDYRKAVDRTVLTFLQRKVKLDPQSCLITHFYKCLDYLLEECPAIMPLWASQGYDFIIYPQPMSDAMQETYQRFVAPLMDKANWLSVRFKRVGQSLMTPSLQVD